MKASATTRKCTLILGILTALLISLGPAGAEPEITSLEFNHQDNCTTASLEFDLSLPEGGYLITPGKANEIDPIWRCVDYARVEAMTYIFDPDDFECDRTWDFLSYSLRRLEPQERVHCRIVFPLVIVDSRLSRYASYPAFGIWDVEQLLVGMSYFPLGSEEDWRVDFVKREPEDGTWRSTSPIPYGAIEMQQRFNFLIKLSAPQVRFKADVQLGGEDETERFVRNAKLSDNLLITH
ncbi:hypothetical protein KQI84_18430 [bacterium]|nr:hypothetical protein [bacterium]